MEVILLVSSLTHNGLPHLESVLLVTEDLGEEFVGSDDESNEQSPSPYSWGTSGARNGASSSS